MDHALRLPRTHHDIFADDDRALRRAGCRCSATSGAVHALLAVFGATGQQRLVTSMG
jgi:hypothetical protein